MSSSVYIDNKKKYILILGKDPGLGLDDTAEAFQDPIENFVSVCITIGAAVFYLLMLQK